MIVRARRKPIEEIPKKYLCCENMRQFYLSQAGIVVEVIVDEVFLKVGTCSYCGHKNVANLVRLNNPQPRFTAIEIECYDLDEGVGDDH